MSGKNVGMPFFSSRAVEGAWGAGRDLSERGSLLKFFPFFFTVKIPDTEARKAVAGRCRLFRSGSPPDFQVVGGPDRPLFR